MKIMNRKPYPTDLTDAQRDILRHLLPQPAATGRPQEWPMREIVNAVLYILQAGCAWRLLPHDFPPWQTVYYHFRKFVKQGVWAAVHDCLVEKSRKREGRNPSPTAGIIDSQTVKTTEQGGPRGYDAAKKITGRKRHIIVDTCGNIMVADVHAADIQDRDGARPLLADAAARFPGLKLIWADFGYSAAKLAAWAEENLGIIIEIVSRPKDAEGFVVLPRRWVVERTFAWISHCRRMSRDYERLAETSLAFIYIAMTAKMLRRLAKV